MNHMIDSAQFIQFICHIVHIFEPLTFATLNPFDPSRCFL